MPNGLLPDSDQSNLSVYPLAKLVHTCLETSLNPTANGIDLVEPERFLLWVNIHADVRAVGIGPDSE